MTGRTPDRFRRSLAGYSLDDAEFLRQLDEPESTNGLRPAAVLAPLFHDGREWRVLFTKRTDKVDSHKGQVSFPGGGREPEDESYLQTALRETWEEIGVEPSDVTLLGRIKPIITITQFKVFPFVGIIPHPYEYRLNGFEVADLLEIPLNRLLAEAGDQDQANPLGMTFNQGGEDIVWGATARMLYELLRIVYPENFD